ncbi:site-specific integrase [Streptomyces sp. NPDC006458]|uniref:tyrosine-type recombinase/integrase n=1 Tax=Streptomyces sp. NPDC006458 TaxID=3154302 RepID=UPI0033A98A19
MARRTTPKVSIAATEFLALRARRSSSKTALYDFRSLLRRFAQRVNDCQVASLVPDNLEDFFYGPGASLSLTCQGGTLRAHKGRLKQFLAFCHRKGWHALTPEALLDGINPRGALNRNRYRMTRPELRRLLECATDPRDRALIAFVANTGVRISEALAMTVQDVSFSKVELHVHLPKTQEEVPLPMSADLEAELRVWLSAYTEAVGQLEKEYRLFPAYRRGRFVDGAGSRVRHFNPTARISNPRMVLQPVADAAGLELEPGDGWHTLRRSFGRIIYEDARRHGHDDALRITQAALNHSKVETTERYLGLDIERQRYADMMRGKPFLTLGEGTAGNIISLRDRRADNG